MIINHNITALNTYRQLNTNSTNQSKSMAKLSSGLRINSAADDAAGLSISEKMKGQIRGLDQASRNAQDGISLIGTAEGALNETQEILQRLRELATQASNGTLTDKDREAVQKETNQLTSEINRIGNTTEFNTQKLLNGGGVEGTLNVKELRTGAAKGSMGTTAVAQDTTAAQFSMDITVAATLGSVGDAKTVEFNGVKIRITRGDDQATTNANGAITATNIDTNSKTIDITYQDRNGTGTAISATDLATAIKDGLAAYKADPNGTQLKDFTFTSSAAVITAAATGPIASGKTDLYNNVAFTKDGTLVTADATVTTGKNVVATTTATSADVTVNKNSTASVAAQWNAALGTLSNNKSATVTFNGVTVTLNSASSSVAASAADGRTASVTVTNGADAEAVGKALKSAFEAAKSFGGQELKNFDFSVTGAGTHSNFVIADKASDGTYNNGLNIVVDDPNSSGFQLGGSTTVNVTTNGVNEVRGEYSYKLDKAFEAVGTTVTIAGKTFTAVSGDADASQGQFNISSDPNEQASSLVKAMNADSNIKSRFDVVVNGSQIKFTEKQGMAAGTDLTNGFVENNTATTGKYAISVDQPVAVGGKYTIDGVDIRVTSDSSDSGLANGSAVMFDATSNGQAQKLRDAILANSGLNQKYSVSASGSMITLDQNANHESMIQAKGSTNTNYTGEFDSKFQIGANSGQTMSIGIKDMRSQALQVSSAKGGGTITASNGQVASFVAISNVTNGTDNKNVEYALDLSTTDKASAAISVIDDAINAVSAQRSALGAYQNRLEHTINNLNTSSQNITDAQSRITDVDMAKEMMNQTKSSVLAQAAQAMLAQANQQPQQVLQLLRG